LEEINEVIREMGMLNEGEERSPLTRPLRSKIMDLMEKMNVNLRKEYVKELKNIGEEMRNERNEKREGNESKVEGEKESKRERKRREREIVDEEKEKEKRRELKENEKRMRIEKENEKRKEIEKEKGSIERRKRFREKKMIWRVKVDEKKEEKEATASAIDQGRKKEEKEATASAIDQGRKKDERKMDEGKGFMGARLPYRGTWHLRAQNCWICGQPGHRQDQCEVKKKFEDKRFWKKDWKRNDGLKFEKRKFFQNFCLVHGHCGHPTDHCGEAHRVLSPLRFFNRTRRFQQRKFFNDYPLDLRRKFFR